MFEQPISIGDVNVSRNTTKETNSEKKLVQKYRTTSESNVLNSYRSITYNFTLAGLPSSYASNPEKYREGELKYVILKSGGKTANGMSANVQSIKRKERQLVSLPEDPIPYDKEIIVEDVQTGKFLVEGFNKNSPGRFDMFIDNIEIENLLTFTQDSSLSLPTKIKFDVIEPYSINGFIEALHVAAVSSGYVSYVQASFLLKVEFWGIPDSDNNEFKNPEKIPNSTRYFPIGFTNVQVELTERGTRYICSAVPFNERAFGQPNIVKKPIKMKGKTVGEILNNFVSALNEQLLESDEVSKTIKTVSDDYKIEFVEWNKKWIVNSESIIAKSDVLNLYEDNILYKFATPDQGKNAYKPGTSPKEIKYNPSELSINFPENSGIHEIITAVIRDSVYVRDLLNKLNSGDNSSTIIDSDGYINYFSVRLEVENKDIFDPDAKRPYQTYKYIISPYKVHFTRVPLYSQVMLKEQEFTKLVKRKYDYFYMGNNVDVLNFKLNFNTLYFEAVPMSLGKQTFPPYRDSVKAETKVIPDLKSSSKSVQLNNNPSHPSPAIKQIPNSSFDTGNSIPVQGDPYSILAKTMHEAIIDSKASMISGDIEILGDPFYLVSGGIGSYNPEEVSGMKGVVGEGEAAKDYGEINILINFRNPVDIDTLDNGGGMFFAPERVSFSGVYMVTKVFNTFKDGLFKQKLEILRKPGQILDRQFTEVKRQDLLTTKKIPESEPQPTFSNQGYSKRLDSASISDFIQRANPSIGIPAQASNFTNSPGGLGGSNTSVFNRTAGLISADNLLKSGAGIIGQILPTDQFSETRLNLSTFAKIGQDALSSSALLTAAANVVTGNIPSQRVLGNIVGSVLGSSINSALKKSNLGSGIGEGASIEINPASEIPTNPTALDIKFGITDNPSQLLAGTVNNIKTAVEEVGSNAISSVNRLGQNAANLINGIGQKIETSLGTISDPKSLAAKLNLDPSKLSGLSTNLESKLTKQVEKLRDAVPKNLDLTQAYAEGLALDILPNSALSNIPPTQPFRKSSLPDVVIATSSKIKAFAEKSLPSVDSKISLDKADTIRKQISKVTNQVNIIGKNIETSVNNVFKSKDSLQSPLDNLVKKLQDPNAEIYTGTDPIVRARLGLPPLDQN